MPIGKGAALPLSAVRSEIGKEKYSMDDSTLKTDAKEVIALFDMYLSMSGRGMLPKPERFMMEFEKELGRIDGDGYFFLSGFTAACDAILMAIKQGTFQSRDSE